MNAIMARLKRSDEEPDAPTAEVVGADEIRDLLATQRASARLGAERASPY